jgi:hypothetical protein
MSDRIWALSKHMRHKLQRNHLGFEGWNSVVEFRILKSPTVFLLVGSESTSLERLKFKKRG